MFNEIALFGVLVLGVAIVGIFVFLYMRESEHSRKQKIYERSIEDLNQEIFKLHKKLKELELQKELDPIQHIEVHLKKEMKKELAIFQNSISQSIQSLESAILHHKEQIDEKIAILEERVKESMFLPPSTTVADEQKIISMYQGGWSIDSIAKEMRLPKGEVEFILKLSNLK